MTDIIERIRRANYGIVSGLPTSMAEIHRRTLKDRMTDYSLMGRM